MTTLPRFLMCPKNQSFFLFGPRGTGKSYWLSQINLKSIRIDLLSDVEFRKYSTNPDYLIELLEGNPNQSTIIIDEVQKVPTLLSVVHKIMEAKDTRKKIQFILTGSSSNKLRREGVDLLAGRAIVKTLHPFIAAELGKLFNLNKALQLGMLPIVFGSNHPEQTLQSYIGVYLREEVKQEGLVRNLAGFSRFLEALSFSHSEPINLSEVSRVCQVGRTTVIGYMDILQDLLLGSLLPPFSKNVRTSQKETIEHSKFYFFDVGVYRSLRPSGPLDNAGVIEGAVLEGLVYQHLRAWIAYRTQLNKKESLYFWRTKAGSEVDFIIYGEKEIYAFEVKSTAKIKSDDLRGLHSFIEDYPIAKPVLLYRGKERLKKGPILCLPVEEFLSNLHPSKELGSIF